MRSLMAFAAATLLTAILGSTPALAAGHTKVMLNPQPEPPGRALPPGPCRACQLALTQPRVGPGDPVERVTFNPQPDPPGRTRSLNPQPLPPRQLPGQAGGVRR